MINLISKEIAKYETIIIHRHVRPDGDCIGAQLGLKYIIKENFPEKNVFAVGENSDKLLFLGEMDNISNSQYDNALVIVVDTANSERIDDQRYSLGDKIIKIDHHLVVESYGDINWVEKYPSTCELIVELAKVGNWSVSPRAGECLYLGIATDTGRFRFRGVTGDTLRRAGYLLDLGVDFTSLFETWYCDSLGEVRLKGYILNNFKQTNKGVAYIFITNDLLNEYNVTRDQASNMVNMMSGIDGVPIWILLTEADDIPKIKVSMRSLRVPVNEVANKYSGGGHQNAAGATLESENDIENLLTDLDNLL